MTHFIDGAGAAAARCLVKSPPRGFGYGCTKAYMPSFRVVVLQPASGTPTQRPPSKMAGVVSNV